MSTRSVKSSVVLEDTPIRETPKQVEEGIGVFRGLWLTVLFYLVLAFVVWFAWNAWKHDHAPTPAHRSGPHLTSAP